MVLFSFSKNGYIYLIFENGYIYFNDNPNEQELCPDPH